MIANPIHREEFNDLNKIQNNFVQKFYLKQLKKKESYIS